MIKKLFTLFAAFTLMVPMAYAGIADLALGAGSKYVKVSPLSAAGPRMLDVQDEIMTFVMKTPLTVAGHATLRAGTRMQARLVSLSGDFVMPTSAVPISMVQSDGSAYAYGVLTYVSPEVMIADMTVHTDILLGAGARREFMLQTDTSALIVNEPSSDDLLVPQIRIAGFGRATGFEIRY